ncbi:FliH/SctL family protein [Cryobacterium sp. CG_9.6]|uniref:FliH/SctL family protein n=1 Tax=Cryobacterium sp. CG_9.6 TaxID=2760710 RepID=UPI002474AE7A|nr:FliH/SctL family protein [Cryobacterium sp. CG_9.6]MDH6237277.1 flagellar assembly protein FliH [Cryobacterium sp. CG_9.6]
MSTNAAFSSNADFSSLAFPRLQAGVAPINEQDRAAGHAAGYAAGLRAAAIAAAATAVEQAAEHAAVLRHTEARSDRALRLLGAAATALDERTVPLLREAEGTLVRTALDLAEAVLGVELSQGEISARRALERALGQGELTETHTVHMHPDDLAVLGLSTQNIPGVLFVADAALSRGDAVTKFADGFLDARIGTAFTRVKTAILETLP